jgi:hypothetical protein
LKGLTACRKGKAFPHSRAAKPLLERGIRILPDFLAGLFATLPFNQPDRVRVKVY